MSDHRTEADIVRADFLVAQKNQNRQVTGFIGEPAGFKPATRPL
jgi:hypothetical protein